MLFSTATAARGGPPQGNGTHDAVGAAAHDARIKTGVGGPVPIAWREGTLTRAKEIESLSAWLGSGSVLTWPADDMLSAIDRHIEAAREAAGERRRWLGRLRDSASLERAISNLAAAEADLLQVAPPEYVLGQMPSLLNVVQRHLPPGDTRRLEFERLAADLGLPDGLATNRTREKPMSRTRRVS